MSACEMGLYDIVERFNAIDQTANFGPGSRIDDGINLYESATVALIVSKQQEGDDICPLINSLIDDCNLFLSINENFYVFIDLSCSDLKFKHIFNAFIDTMCFSHCNKYVLLCLRNGYIIVYDCVNLKFIHSVSLCDNVWLDEKYYINSFAECSDCDENGFNYIIVDKNGCITRMCVNLIQASSNDIQCEHVFTTILDLHKTITLAVCVNDKLLLVSTDTYIIDLELAEIDMIIDDMDLKKIYPSTYNKFLGLTNDGTLIEISTNTCFVCDVPTNERYRDIVYINQCDRFLYAIRIGGVEEYDYLQALTFPDFTEIFSLPISSSEGHLGVTNTINNDFIYVRKVEYELEVNTISPTVPQRKLERLLRKRQFVEAETYATEYQLDFETIYFAKAQLYADQTSCDSEDIDEFLTVLNKIQDVAFKLKCCEVVTCASIEDYRKIFYYGSNIEIKQNVCDEIEKMQSALVERMYRFDTFMTFKHQQTNDFNSSDWHSFLDSSIFDVLCSKLNNNEIEDAIVIYNRFKVDISTMDEIEIQILLDIIDKSTLSSIEPFIYTFIPQSLVFVPTCLPLLMKWVLNRMYNMERIDAFYFTENAIDFLNKIVVLLKIDEKYNEDWEEEIEKIRNIRKALNTIQTLKNNFNFFISLAECLKGPQQLIRTLLTLEIIDFDQFVIFLRTFMLENTLNPDLIFTEEIANLVAYNELYWRPIAIPLWNCIYSLEKKLKALLLMLSNAEVPWCLTIKHLAQSALEFNHPLVDTLKQVIQLEPIRIVLNRPDYKLPLYDYDIKRIYDDTQNFVMSRIIHCNAPTMIDDIYMLCDTPEKRVLMNCQMMYEFISNNKLDEAYGFLKRNSSEEVYNYFEILLERCTMDMERGEYTKAMLSFIEDICTKATSWCEDDWITEQWQNLKSINFVNTTFKKKIKKHDLSKMDVLDSILLEIVQNLQHERITHAESIRLCEKLSIAFRKSGLLLKLNEKIDDSKLLNACATHLYENTNDLKLFDAMVKFVVGQSSCTTNVNLDDTFAIGIVNSASDYNVVTDNLFLAKQMSIKMMRLDQGCDTLELYTWASHSIQDPQPIYMIERNYYDVTNLRLFVNSIDSMKEIFRTSINYVGGCEKHVNNKYLNSSTQVATLTEVEYVKVMNERLPILFKKIISEGNFLGAYSLILKLHNCLLANKTNAEMMSLVVKIQNQCIRQLLQKVLMSASIDEELAFSLLISFDYANAVKIISNGIKSYINTIKKVESIAKIGIRLSKYHEKMDGNYDTCLKAVLCIKWWKKIINCVIPYKDFFCFTRVELLNKLIEYNHVDVKLIEDYCVDFKMDVSIYYMTHLKNTLVNWKPKYQIVESGGKRDIVMENDEHQLFEDCMKIISLIKNKASITESFDNLWNSVNFYHYEVFMCLLKIVSTLTEMETPSKTMLLSFLKQYKRFSKPTPNEDAEWFNKYPHKPHLDPLAEWRLPQTPTLQSKELWNIIKQEVNLKTYQTWCENVLLLDGFLTKDEICCYAAKQVISSNILKLAEPTEWVMHAKHEDLFKQINECLSNVTNPNFKTSAAYYIATCTPSGADQVHAMEIAYKYANQHKDFNGESGQTYIKIKNKYLTLSTMHILYINGLADDKYKEIVGSPQELIETLYMDERVILKYNCVILNCPDINKAVEELSILHGINLQETQTALINNWLMENCQENFDLEQTILSPTITLTGNAAHETDCNAYLKRIVYLCASGDISIWRNFLIHIGLSDSSFILRARALKCFSLIATDEEIKKSIGIKALDYQDFVKKLFILHELKTIGIVIEEVELLEVLKLKCIKKLSNNVQNAQTVQIMGSLCLLYNIYDVQYWEIIFKYSIRFDLIDHLKIYINALKDRFYYKAFYIAAWQKIIDSLFTKTDNKLDIYNLYVSNIRYIQTCPVINEIKFEEIFETTIGNNCLELSAWLLQYIRKNKRKEYVDMFINKIQAQKMNYVDLVKNLSSLGFWGCDKADSRVVEKM